MNTSANEVDTNVKVQNVSPPSANGNVKRAAVAKSVAEFMSRVTEAAQKGFTVGTLVKPKNRSDAGHTAFQISSITEDTVEVKSVTVGMDVEVRKIVTAEFLTTWRVGNEKIPTKLDGWSFFGESMLWEWECIKAQVQYPQIVLHVLKHHESNRLCFELIHMQCKAKQKLQPNISQ